MKIDYLKAIVGGVVGALAMSAVGLYAAPMMGIPPMNPANMLAMAMGNNMLLGWMGHLMIGTVLAIIYAFVQSYIPGPAAARGALFSLAPWLMAQIVVMPMMGMPLFSGSVAMAGGSLVGHIVYGAIVGLIYGEAKA